jgi:hypothetical protein
VSARPRSETGARERLYAVACAAMFVFGIILGLPGTVLGLPEVAAQFQLTLADRGTFGILLILGAATEASVAAWTSTFLTASGVGPEAATWALSSHWLGLIAGRVVLAGRVDVAKGAAIGRAALAGTVCLLIFVARPRRGSSRRVPSPSAWRLP